MTARQKLKEIELVVIVVKGKTYYAAPIKAYAGYFATTCGNIISYVSGYNGQGARITKGQPRVLVPQETGNGYRKLKMTTREGKHTQEKVHRLVALTFLEPAGDDRNGNSRLEVNHLNGNRSDNRLCNLELVSRSENQNWAVLLKAVMTEKCYAA